MNVFILTDLEGIGGVVDIEFMDRSGEKYALARRLLSSSIDLAVKTAFESGAENVYYLDGHGGGGNVIEDMIDPRARKCGIAEWQQLLCDGKIDCQIELGAHARAGTVGGFLDHTISSREWFSLRVNGEEMSELSMHALVAGAYGVPIVACIGDEVACHQAKEYIPDIFVGALKHASCRNLAKDYENTDAILKETVKRALENYKSVPVYKVGEPATVELTFYRTDMCENALMRCTDEVERIDARTLRRTVRHITKYEDLKF
ncbi:MAG: M55 family metallopeptidase [Clostridia bacterium]|nr:M55 family metallopeptidase [Clostridia bacterium]